LSSKIPVAYVDIRTFAHATEDLDKVLSAVHNALPAELIDSITFKKTGVTGHHGNPIVLLETRVKEKSAAQAVFRKMASGLNMLDKELLGIEIQNHLEKGNLYIRLDKQTAYLNELRLCQTDPIHFRVHFKRHDPEEVIAICREFGLIS
jgi:hypothetical protein